MDVLGVAILLVCTFGNMVEGDRWLSKDSVLRLSIGAAPRAGWWFCIEARSASASMLGVEDMRGRGSLVGVSTIDPIVGLLPGDARVGGVCVDRA